MGQIQLLLTKDLGAIVEIPGIVISTSHGRRGMDGIVSTKLFRDFYRKISVETETLDDYFGILKQAVPILADTVRLGRLQLLVNSPANSLVYEEIQDRCEIYLNPNGFNPDCGYRQTFVTKDWGIIQLEAYSRADFEWNESFEDEIDFLTQVVFDCIQKARVSIVMKQAAITDSLTGACNAIGGMNYAYELKKRGEFDRYDAVYLNIKNFNYINQRIGGSQADTVLKEFSRMVREYLKKGELFGRSGGDTFFLLVEKARTEACISFLTSRKILVELERKNMEFDLMVRLGAYSIQPQDTPERALQAAKTAYLYTKNPSAGDVVWFSEDMINISKHDREVAANFNTALKKNEFVVYYQPKVDISTGRLISAEALCRWIMDGRLVPPMEFIPTLEREGSICDLDFYMLHRVCEHITLWKSKGIEPVKISVNFSKIHNLNRKLAEKIIKVICGHKVECQYLEIEITEMSGYEDFDSLSEFVDTMKEYGIETSLDDFGTGYSSLNLLKELRVDTVKLDRSFLQKIGSEDSTDRSMIKSIINMVNDMNMKVVAEGVETDLQRDFLREVNCQEAQGYLFDKPLPEEEFELRLQGERIY